MDTNPGELTPEMVASSVTVLVTRAMDLGREADRLVLKAQGFASSERQDVLAYAQQTRETADHLRDDSALPAAARCT